MRTGDENKRTEIQREENGWKSVLSFVKQWHRLGSYRNDSMQIVFYANHRLSDLEDDLPGESYNRSALQVVTYNVQFTSRRKPTSERQNFLIQTFYS